MRIITEEIYMFFELSETAQQKAINEYKVFTDFIWHDAKKTVDKFNWVFDLESGNRSWLEFNSDSCNNNAYQYDLKGLRLCKFIINNFDKWIYSKKTFYTIGHKKTRKSKIQIDNVCVLTGVCYDMDILQPVYDFIEKYNDSMSETTFKSLMKDCYNNLKKSIENEIDYLESEEAIKERIESENLEFYQDGTQY